MNSLFITNIGPALKYNDVLYFNINSITPNNKSFINKIYKKYKAVTYNKINYEIIEILEKDFDIEESFTDLNDHAINPTFLEIIKSSHARSDIEKEAYLKIYHWAFKIINIKYEKLYLAIQKKQDDIEFQVIVNCPWIFKKYKIYSPLMFKKCEIHPPLITNEKKKMSISCDKENMYLVYELVTLFSNSVPLELYDISFNGKIYDIISPLKLFMLLTIHDSVEISGNHIITARFNAIIKPKKSLDILIVGIEVMDNSIIDLE